nr:GTPase [Streptomyces lycii]
MRTADARTADVRAERAPLVRDGEPGGRTAEPAPAGHGTAGDRASRTPDGLPSQGPAAQGLSAQDPAAQGLSAQDPAEAEPESERAPEPEPEPGGDEDAPVPEPGSAGAEVPPLPEDGPVAKERKPWDDGLIARRAPEDADARADRAAEWWRADFRPGSTAGAAEGARSGPDGRSGGTARDGGGRGKDTTAAEAPRRTTFNRALRIRLDALRELVGLSRTRLDPGSLTEAGHVLEEAVARRRLSLDHTVVALAGASGSGKSTLFNALAGAPLSEAGVRRPTTSEPLACTWSEGADGLLDRLGVPPRLRRRSSDTYLPGSGPEYAAEQGASGGGHDLSGLVLVDLPDHDSAVPGHREQVDRLLELVDAVVWVVDPEKYADAVLHERYLRPLAAYDEVTFVVLNQTDRLPGDAADKVLDDLRRLLDEDGLALGEHGEPGAAVLGVSALTGDGVGELREQLARFTAGRGAAENRLAADVDGAAARLAPVCLADGWTGLSAWTREEFESRLAESVGAVAAGQAAEREWQRQAELAYGAPWVQLRGWLARRRAAAAAPREPGAESGTAPGTESGTESGTASAIPSGDTSGDTSGGEHGTDAGTGIRNSIRSDIRSDIRSGIRTGMGADGIGTDAPGAGTGAGARAGSEADTGTGAVPEPRTSRAVVEQAVRTVAGDAAAGLPDPWARAVRDAAVRGAERLPDALDEVAAARAADSCRPTGPGWWAVASVAQGLMLALQAGAAVWLVMSVAAGPGADWRTPALLMAAGVAGGPVLAWACRLAARGPARAYGQEAERRLRDAAAACGRSRVLEPVAAELLRYREARIQYTVAAGDTACV